MRCYKVNVTFLIFVLVDFCGYIHRVQKKSSTHIFLIILSISVPIFTIFDRNLPQLRFNKMTLG